MSQRTACRLSNGDCTIDNLRAHAFIVGAAMLLRQSHERLSARMTHKSRGADLVGYGTLRGVFSVPCRLVAAAAGENMRNEVM